MSGDKTILQNLSGSNDKSHKSSRINLQVSVYIFKNGVLPWLHIHFAPCVRMSFDLTYKINSSFEFFIYQLKLL